MHVRSASFLPSHRSLPFSLPARTASCPEQWMQSPEPVLLTGCLARSCPPGRLRQQHSSQQCLGELQRPLPRQVAPQGTCSHDRSQLQFILCGHGRWSRLSLGPVPVNHTSLGHMQSLYTNSALLNDALCRGGGPSQVIRICSPEQMSPLPLSGSVRFDDHSGDSTGLGCRCS